MKSETASYPLQRWFELRKEVSPQLSQPEESNHFLTPSVLSLL